MQEAQETWVGSLGQENPLEEETATYSTIAWKIPWTEEPGGLQPMGLQRLGYVQVTDTFLTFTVFLCIACFQMISFNSKILFFFIFP